MPNPSSILMGDEWNDGPAMTGEKVNWSDGELREIAIMALGRISVELFQPGGGTEDLIFDTPDFDYLVTRAGGVIGYGELANLFDAALAAELASRK